MHLKSWGYKMKVIVYGYGLMGKKVANKVRSQSGMDLTAVISYEFDEKIPEKSFNSLKECEEKADMVQNNWLKSLMPQSKFQFFNLTIHLMVYKW